MRIVEIRSYEPRPKKPTWPWVVAIFIIIAVICSSDDKKTSAQNPAAQNSFPAQGAGGNESGR
jgi:hypothetical protein